MIGSCHVAYADWLDFIGDSLSRHTIIVAASFLTLRTLCLDDIDRMEDTSSAKGEWDDLWVSTVVLTWFMQI